MYDIDYLICIVNDAFEAEKSYLAYCRKTRAEVGLPPGAEIWIPSLSGNTAYRLGELCERYTQKWRQIADICKLLNIDQDRLLAAVKAIGRGEANHEGCALTVSKNSNDGARLIRFLRNNGEENKYYRSAGQEKSSKI